MKTIPPTVNDDAGRYRLLVEAVTDYAIYMLSPEGIVISWNAGAQRFKGYTPDEIIGQHFSRFYTDVDQKSGLPAHALKTAEREGKFESQGWRVRKDGTQFWAHVVIDPIRGPGGEITGYAKITRDLTERKEAEETLRRSQEQFRLLVQGVTDYAIYLLSPEGIVTNWNAGAQRIKGYLPEEIIGKSFSLFYREEDRLTGEPERALETARREGRVEREGWRVRKDGTAFWSNVVIDAIRNDEGEVIGFAKITRDITDRKATETKLEQAREALFQSQKMDAIGQLTGGVAHDFNNLLMAILGSLTLLRKRLPDDKHMVRLLDNAITGTNRGVALTQRMLAFARRQEIHPEPLDLSTLVRGMADLLDRSLGPSVEIETRFPLSLSRVMADANQLELALLNLCVNARDAMGGSGTIVISAREQQINAGHETRLADGRYICLAVSDTGEGMSEEMLARATEPFYTTKGVGKGTGLGLSMVHGMAEQMHGRLILKSKLGQGTTAEVWLPVAEASNESKKEAPKLDESEARGRTLHILAVDDDALVLFNTAAMLQELGHTVIEVSSGEAALRALRKHQVDLVITDHAMPKMTGLQLLDAIQAEWPNLPVVLATGYAELPGGLEANVPRLSKPFSERELAKLIAMVAPNIPLQTAPRASRTGGILPIKPK